MVSELFGLALNLVSSDHLVEAGEPFCTCLKRISAREGVRLVGDPSAMDRLSVHAVALVVV